MISVAVVRVTHWARSISESPRIIATLVYHIPTVVSRGTQEEMIRTDTFSVVALMADVHTLWYWTVRDDPRRHVRSDWAVRSTGHLSVAGRLAYVALPFPATFRLLNPLP